MLGREKIAREKRGKNMEESREEKRKRLKRLIREKREGKSASLPSDPTLAVLQMGVEDASVLNAVMGVKGRKDVKGLAESLIAQAASASAQEEKEEEEDLPAETEF